MWIKKYGHKDFNHDIFTHNNYLQRVGVDMDWDSCGWVWLSLLNSKNVNDFNNKR